MSNFWHWTVIIVVVLHLIAYLWLLFSTSKKKTDKRADNTTGHVWDGDLKEWLDNSHEKFEDRVLDVLRTNTIRIEI